MFEEKLARLEDAIRAQGSVLVAYSGGVDSSVLAGVSHNLLGDNAVAVTADSPTLAASELECAKKIAAEIGIRHIIVDHNELVDERFANNPDNRCYFCKHGLFELLEKTAKMFKLSAIIEGTNADELGGHRPGYKAALEHGVLTPLADAGFTKDDVRALAKRLMLSNSSKPSTACLSSRVVSGVKITDDVLRRIEAGEDFLRGLGVGQLRLRYYGDSAKIDVLESDFEKIMKNRSKIVERLGELGFTHVSLDLRGYRSGSLNH